LGGVNQQMAPDWKLRLTDCLPLFGHRNWVVVADSAYPAQSSPGIETVVAPSSQIEVVQAVADAISASKHIKGRVLSGTLVDRIPHEEIIARLDQSARVFRILIIKTPMTIPYTSVFFELDCSYWSSEAEQKLRESMRAL